MSLELSKPLTLPCGLTLPNRLSKAAMAESWADKKRLPRQKLIDVYEAWADGGWGMVMTGNVQVDVAYLGTPEDHAINDEVEYEEHVASWKKWSNVTNAHGTPTIVQLNHPGRQSLPMAGNRGLFAKTIAPSVVPVQLGDGYIAKAISCFVFGSPREMTVEDIEDVVQRFVKGAKISADAGFAGIEIHGAHGYLIAQFLSAKTNHRTDAYGGTPRKRAKIVVDIIEAVRKTVPKTFCVGIKLNSVDHQSESELAECIEQLEEIAGAGIDFLEISGGTYENPTMIVGNGVSERTAAREAFFLDFARAIREQFRDIPLMVTGGFRTREGMETAIKEGACDIIGLGRPAVVQPALPKELILNKQVKDEDAKTSVKAVPPSFLSRTLGMKGLGGATDTLYYVGQIHKIQRKL